jgi:hypothetical protein
MPQSTFLDEATSALDTESERLVEALATLMMNRPRSSSRIGCRPSGADAIIAEKGTVVEMGRHDDPSPAAGAYATLYQMQRLEGRKTAEHAPRPCKRATLQSPDARADTMIKSMTGFASVSREEEHATIGITIRALNHRHLDLQLRIPQSLAALNRTSGG